MKAKAYQKNNVYLKQLSVFGFLAFILLFVPGVSLAEEALGEPLASVDVLYNYSEQINSNNPDSEEVVTDISNVAELTNEIDADVNTGTNNASGNNGDGSVTTGDANTAVTVINQANSEIILPDGSSLSIIKENILGDFSGNYLLSDDGGNVYRLSDDGQSLIPIGCGEDPCQADQGEVIYIGTNAANILNTFKIISNTGQNQASDNGGAGTIKTGDSNVAVNLLNIINTTIVVGGTGTIGYINVLGDWNGNLEVPDEWLSILGDDEPDTTLVLFVPGSHTFYLLENYAQNSNLIQVTSNTGGNEANGNVGAGDIVTGDSVAKISILNLENQAIIGGNILFFVVNVLGDWNGGSEIDGLLASNQVTLETDGLSQNGSESVLIKNEAFVTNTIEIDANTGGNKANDNGDDGFVTTGDSRIIVNVLNFLNLSIIADNVRLVLINVLGDWNGGIVPEPYIVPGEDDDNQNGTGATVQAQSVFSSTPKARRNRIILASAVASESDSEGQPAIALDQEIKGDLNPKTGSENKCNWWWIISLLLLLALFGNYILADISTDKQSLDYLLGVTPLLLGVIALWAHSYLSANLSHSVYCDYLWLIVLIELAVYYLLRYRGFRIAKK